MCGICGFFGFEDNKLIKDMTDILSHRGPDDQGQFVDKNVSLGHRRLSIIDLSEKGRQPMFNEDGSICIVYNGEIYNYKELREIMRQKGHRFNSDTDTEVIIHCYEEFGNEVASYLNGDFAFAIYDSNREQVYMARDYAGVKPLYYYYSKDKLVFASEIKSILLDPGIERSIDYDSFHDFLTLRYVPGSRTLFKGIKKLLPGHYLICSKHKINIVKYWDLNLSNQLNCSESYYEKKILQSLKESVNKRLMSDVPLGAYLSGGLDSSIIVGLMSNLVDVPIKTFSVGFGDDEEYDETKYARVIAEKFNTEHNELLIDASSIHALPKILWHMDEPIADAAAVPTYLLSEFAKKKVSVVMTGEGADEIFAGYYKYKIMAIKNYYDKLPYVLRSKIIPSVLNTISKSDIFNRMAEFSSSNSRGESYLGLVSFFSNKEKQTLCSKEFLKSISLNDPLLHSINAILNNDKNILNNYLYLDFKTWLPDCVLTKVDKMCMAHSVEARVPFLDKEFLNLCSKIPYNMKLNNFTEKYILKKSMKKIIPKEIVNRKKHGFNVPVKHWLDNELKEIALQLLSEANINRHNFYNYSTIKKITDNYEINKTYYSRQLWILLNFELWYQIYFEGIDYNKIEM